jgi:short-subunit dehydrogenase
MNTFKEKYGPYALITGATSGIGKALSEEIAKKGLNLILVARGMQELENCTKELTSGQGIDVIPVQADLSTQEGMDHLIEKTQSYEIGLFIPAAGLETNGFFTKNDLQKELTVLQLNVISTLSLTYHFSKKMVERKRGGILLVSSLSGHMPNPYFSNYAGSKAYVLNFGLSLHGELAKKGVDVSILSPGLTNTAMSKNTGVDWKKTPMKIMEANKVAEIAIKNLGKKVSIVPGRMNKMMAFMAKYMTPFSMGSTMNEKMMRKAIAPDKL